MTAPRLNATEIFLLALVVKGVNTFYRLREKAELSPGTTQRYLARLEQLGLVERAEDAAERNRREFSATGTGRRLLRPTWERAAMRADQDFISVIRVAGVGYTINPDEAADFLERAAEKRASLAAEQQVEAAKLPAPKADMLTLYHWMRAVALAQQYAAEEKTFKNLAERVRSTK